MKVEHLTIKDIILITPRKFLDNRGFFSETYNQDKYKDIGLTLPFVQDNQSLSRQKGVVRGLHCQLAPYEQGKLVRCSRGAIWDVAVDARSSSPTYGEWVGAELSEDNGSQLWIPSGFLHGFVTLTENAEVNYKCTALYNKEAERSVLWNCPHLNILWPMGEYAPVLSEKDQVAPDFSAVNNWFRV